jgi:hypothetical protein
MDLQFYYYKWVTPFNLAQLSPVEQQQILSAGRNWWSMDGDFSPRDVLRNTEEGSDFAELDVWRVKDTDGKDLFDVWYEGGSDTASVFLTSTAQEIGIAMIQGYFCMTDEQLSGIAGDSLHWIKLLQEAWRKADFREGKEQKTLDEPRVIDFVIKERKELLESMPFTAAKVRELAEYIRKQKWTPEREFECNIVRRFMEEQHLLSEPLLLWFSRYRAVSDNGILRFIHDSLRPDK